jgi:murein DD-endopeptidase MepM/ murein hydrolase activator NlpD
MQRIAFSSVVVACLSITAAVRGERSGGIGSDVAIAEALSTLEAQTATNTQLTDELATLDEREQALQLALREHVRALYRVTRNGNAPVASGFDAMRSYLSRVRRLKSKVVSDLLAVDALHRQQQTKRGQARQAEQALAAVQQELTQLRAAPQVMTPARAERPRPAAEAEHAFYGLRLSNGQTITPFEEQRGKLAPPISGELRMRDVQRNNATMLLFEAEQGSSVRAIAAGVVSWTDAHTVVIDHGGGYQSAYSQVGNVEVRTGDSVSALARLGNLTDPEEPALLFEIRKGSRSVPARAWLGL